jgi:thiol-disulfide isomerase/thioredoxin
MRRSLIVALWLLAPIHGLLAASSLGQFRVSPEWVETPNGGEIRVRFDFPIGRFIYAGERLQFRLNGYPGVAKFQLPAASRMTVGASTKLQSLYREPFTATFFLPSGGTTNLVLEVLFHGCDTNSCEFPELRRYSLSPGRRAEELKVDPVDLSAAEPPRWRMLMTEFSQRSLTHAVDEPGFLTFIRSSGAGSDRGAAPASKGTSAGGAWLKVSILVLAVLITMELRRFWQDLAHSLRGRQWVGWAASAVVSLAFALWILSNHWSSGTSPSIRANVDLDEEDADDQLSSILEAARDEGVPIFVDFWATWCSPCDLMERNVLSTPTVTEALSRFDRVRIRAESPTSPAARELLEYFDAKGLPTYVVLVPRNGEAVEVLK